MEVIISILVQDTQLRKRCEALLTGHAGLRQLRDLFGSNLSYEVNHENAPEQGAELLEQLFLAPGRVVIVISDLMAEPPSAGQTGPKATNWWYQLVAAAGPNEHRLGSVAITGWAPSRVPDVDRVVAPGVEEAALFEAIGRTILTLDYKQKPQHRTPEGLIVIRQVRTVEELRAYYGLRHRIYSIMGYLDAEIERVSTQQEIDWCDLFSVPIAAFEAGPDGAARIVGTARIITTRPSNPQLFAATEAIAAEDQDGLLIERLNQVYPFQMPFLQSHPDPEILTSLNRHYSDAFCEISRVIVDRDHRGMGLSTVLVNYTMMVARWMGMKRLFLECLPTHRSLYERFHFRLVPGRRDRVYLINKTMNLMERDDSDRGAAPASGRRYQREIDRLQNSGYLCLCEKWKCPSGDRDAAAAGRRRYAGFLAWDCPIAQEPAPWLVTPEDKHLCAQWPGMESYDDD
jgi:N-acetylglutamate synthase-like GNAT family acetyltransferase